MNVINRNLTLFKIRHFLPLNKSISISRYHGPLYPFHSLTLKWPHPVIIVHLYICRNVLNTQKLNIYTTSEKMYMSLKKIMVIMLKNKNGKIWFDKHRWKMFFVYNDILYHSDADVLHRFCFWSRCHFLMKIFLDFWKFYLKFSCWRSSGAIG